MLGGALGQNRVPGVDWRKNWWSLGQFGIRFGVLGAVLGSQEQVGGADWGGT